MQNNLVIRMDLDNPLYLGGKVIGACPFPLGVISSMLLEADITVDQRKVNQIIRSISVSGVLLFEIIVSGTLQYTNLRLSLNGT